MIIPNYNKGTIDVYLDAKCLGKCQDLAKIFDKTTTDEKEGWGGLGTYGGGIGNSPKDTNNVERTGALGEKAFSLLTGIPMNEQFKKNGDAGFDFLIPSFSIDIKCHTRHPNQAVEWGFYGDFFTKAHLSNGSYVAPRADIIIFSAIIAGDSFKEDYGSDWDAVGVNSGKSNNVIIRFFGAISSKEIFINHKDRLGAKLQRGGPTSYSKFKNYYIKKEELLPMIDFSYKYKHELFTTKSGVII